MQCCNQKMATLAIPSASDITGAALPISTVCTVLCLPSTFLLVNAHRQAWKRPELQLCVVRILLMVPIYAIDSWLGLIQHGSDSARGIVDTARECYEAFVIYNFVLFLVGYFGTEQELAALLHRKRPSEVPHLPPLQLCLPRWRMGQRYLSICKRGALQYVVVRLATSLLVCLCKLFDTAGVLPHFEEGNFSSAYPYLVMLNTASQCWALYCLVMFFRAVREELAPIRPIGKFICVKSVIFLTFWQDVRAAARCIVAPERRTAPRMLSPCIGWLHPSPRTPPPAPLGFVQAALALAGHMGMLEPTQAAQGVSAQQAASTINGMLICVEMLVASLVHPFCFPPSDYAPERAARSPTLNPSLSAALFEALIPKDVASDVRQASWNLVNPEQLGLAGTGGLVTPEGERGGLSREASSAALRGSAPTTPAGPRRAASSGCRAAGLGGTCVGTART